MEGEAKRDYPASIFYQSGWYRDYPYVENYFTRLNEIVSKGEPLCETLVLNPVESMWLYPRKGWLKNLFELTIEEGVRLEEAYIKLFKILTTGRSISITGTRIFSRAITVSYRKTAMRN